MGGFNLFDFKRKLFELYASHDIVLGVDSGRDVALSVSFNAAKSFWQLEIVDSCLGEGRKPDDLPACRIGNARRLIPGAGFTTIRGCMSLMSALSVIRWG